MRSNNLLSAGSPSHFLRMIAFRRLSLGAFSSQSIMMTFERSRFSADKSCKKSSRQMYLHVLMATNDVRDTRSGGQWVGLQIKWSGFEPRLGSLYCVLGQRN